MPRPPLDRDATPGEDVRQQIQANEFGITSAFRRSSNGGLAALAAAWKNAPGARRAVHIHVSAGEPIGWQDLIVADAPPQAGRRRCLRVSRACRAWGAAAAAGRARAYTACSAPASAHRATVQPRRPPLAAVSRDPQRPRRATATAVGVAGPPLPRGSAVRRAAGPSAGGRRARGAAARIACAAGGDTL
jgi:hypothetical protein